MNISLPFVGFIKKTIDVNIIVQAFLDIFSNTEDRHRVFIIVPVVLLLSHTYFLATKNVLVRQLRHVLNRDEIIWLVLASIAVLFILSWAVFSSEFNPRLYIRQVVIAIWTALIHRLVYGLEIPGTTYFTAVSIIALVSFLPFALTGLKAEELFVKLKDDYKSSKEPEEDDFVTIEDDKI